MKVIYSIRSIIAVWLSLIPLFLMAAHPEDDEILFYIVRSKDADKIYYQANLDREGNLVADKPVNIFWIRQTQNNQKEPLTRIQNNYGYGLQFLEVNPRNAVFRFISFPDKTFVLQKDDSGTFRVFTSGGDHEMVVNSLSVHFANDSYWFPRIKRVELHATGVNTGSPVVEYIEP